MTTVPEIPISYINAELEFIVGHFENVSACITKNLNFLDLARNVTANKEDGRKITKAPIAIGSVGRLLPKVTLHPKQQVTWGGQGAGGP